MGLLFCAHHRDGIVACSESYTFGAILANVFICRFPFHDTDGLHVYILTGKHFHCRVYTAHPIGLRLWSVCVRPLAVFLSGTDYYTASFIGV